MRVRPAFDLLKEYLDETFDLQTTSEVCHVDPQAVRSLARQLAANKGNALLAAGMGPNHYFNNDLFGRVHFLVAALTDNIGHFSGNVGSYAGNYRGSLFQAMGQWIAEDPFDIEPDLTKPANVKRYYKAESAHYWNYGDRPLAIAAGGHHRGDAHADPDEADLVRQLELAPRQREVVVRRRQEHAAEAGGRLLQRVALDELVRVLGHRVPGRLVGRVQAPGHDRELYEPPSCWPSRRRRSRGSTTRAPTTRSSPGSPRGSRTSQRSRACARTGRASSTATRPRTSSASSPARTRPRGILYDELHSSCADGVPLLMNPRTYPRHGGWEQRQEDKPWYTPTGRLEFYRPEREWQEAGESLPVWREPVDATFHEPNVILSNRQHPSIAPKTPEEYGVPSRSSTSRRASTGTSSARGRS